MGERQQWYFTCTLCLPDVGQAAREARGLEWYALAKLAGILDQGTIPDIEQGKDVKLSNLQAVAEALGMRLELVEQMDGRL
jgi:transcriptional regulator with XRE-family HTH domain